MCVPTGKMFSELSLWFTDASREDVKPDDKTLVLFYLGPVAFSQFMLSPGQSQCGDKVVLYLNIKTNKAPWSSHNCLVSITVLEEWADSYSKPTGQWLLQGLWEWRWGAVLVALSSWREQGRPINSSPGPWSKAWEGQAITPALLKECTLEFGWNGWFSGL